LRREARGNKATSEQGWKVANGALFC
jgi:hypothetical protein